jgi:hypothetical protein
MFTMQIRLAGGFPQERIGRLRRGYENSRPRRNRQISKQPAIRPGK